jgi:hypothetical protein
MGAAFSILEYPGTDSTPVVFSEGDTGSRLSRDAGVIAWSRRRFQAVRDKALSASGSAQLIEKTLEEL